MRDKERDSLLAGLYSRKLRRRDFLIRMGAGGVALGLMGAGIACDDDEQRAPGATPTPGEPGTDLESGPLVVYNWAEYLSPEAIKRFAEEFDVRVDLQLFDNNETMYTRLAGGATGYDTTVPADYQIPIMSAEDLLLPLDHSLIPNIANIDNRYLDTPYDPGNRYSLPKNLVLDGPVYRTDLVDTQITSWAEFLEAAKRFSGKVAIMDVPGEIVAMALKATGHSVDATDDDALQDAEEWLLELRPHILGIVVLGELRPLLQSAEAVMAITAFKDATTLKPEGVAVEVVFPSEGSVQVLDEWVIPSATSRPRLAHAWLNFLHRPDIAAIELEFNLFPTVNRAAIEEGRIAEELLDDPALNPPDDVRDRLEFIPTLEAEDQRKRNDIWLRFRAG